MTEALPYVLPMVVLALASAFFSCSEAALFYLRREDRDGLAAGGAGERAAAALLGRPERLLTSILFWNLVINMAYFALSALWALKLERAGATRAAAVLAAASLMTIIIISEMLPKNLGVLMPRRLAGLLGLPLAAATRLLDPVLPHLGAASDLAERLIAPRFQDEAYLELGDLERAISFSGSDPTLIEQERKLLGRIVSLSETRVEEVMRERRQYLAFTPPVTVEDLRGRATPSGYLLITDPDSDELAAALPMEEVALLRPGARLDRHARPVVLVPWCATSASVLSELRRTGRRVAAVLNELGETIGVATIDDLVGGALQGDPPRRSPGDRTGRIAPLPGGAWLATGRTTLRRVAKQLGRDLPPTRSITVTGMMQEQLQGMPRQGDTARWGGLLWTVLRHEPSHLEVRIQPDPGSAE